MVQWRREWQTTSALLPSEFHEQYEKAVHYMTYLFCNWKFVTFDHLHSFLLTLTPTSGNHHPVLCAYQPGFLFLLLFFPLQIIHMNKITLCFSFSVWCILLSKIPSRCIQRMARFHSLLWLSNIPLCVCVCVCVSISIYLFIYMCQIFFIHSSIIGPSSYFHILAIVNIIDSDHEGADAYIFLKICFWLLG